MSTVTSIPKTMRALFLTKHVKSYDQEDLASCFEVREVDVPTPKSGEVLIKVECSAINPSDLSQLQGTYGDSGKKPLPWIPGNEASGVVVANGGGLLGWMVNGKRVGVVGGPVWAEYAVVPATKCLALPDNVSFEAGSSCFVNPLTAVAFVEIAQARKIRAIVHTAAASTLGKMLVKYARQNNVEVICVVRRQEQVDTLKELGANHIVNSSEENWQETLTKKCTELGCTVAFDAIAGSTTGEILHCMPNGSEVFVYGGLSEKPCSNIHPGDLIFQSKKVSGFWLVKYMQDRGMMGSKGMLTKVSKALTTSLGTNVRVSYPLEEATAAFQDYKKNMSLDKVVFRPSSTSSQEGASSSAPAQE